MYKDLDSLNTMLPYLFASIGNQEAEVIVVDNGGEVNNHLKDIPFNDKITFLVEDKYLNSPYSCRNRGIEAAKGEIVVFLDSTCKPIKSWLKEILHPFHSKDVFLVGGEVRFDVYKNSTSYEVADAIRYVQTNSIIQKGYATTANLAVRKDLIDKIGLFPEGIRTGGDMQWTKRATNAGYKLIYAKKAIVFKKPRKKEEIINKAKRVGSGLPGIWMELRRSVFIQSAKLIFSVFVPPNPFLVLSSMKRKGVYRDHRNKFIKIYFVYWKVTVFKLMGLVKGLKNSYL